MLMALEATVTACGTLVGTGPPSSGSVLGRRFVATEASDGDKPRLLTGQVILDFTKPGSVSVSTGCNSASGAAHLRDGRLVSQDMNITAIGCPKALADQERFVLGLVAATPTATLTGDELVLRSPTAWLRLVDRRVADPDRPLERTRWGIDGTLPVTWPSRPAAASWLSATGR